MKASTRAMVRKHIYWQDVAGKMVEAVGTVATAMIIAWAMVECLFPNMPLQ